jgi:DNA polymerase-3 subunit chi
VERIDFYPVLSSEARAIELFACRLAEKAHAQAHRIFIRTADREQAQALNELLWTFRQGSFVPHALADAADPEDTVLIGNELPEHADRDLLINLAPSLAPGWQQFRRLAEVFGQDPAALEEARQRFRHYRSQGFNPETHKLEAEA